MSNEAPLTTWLRAIARWKKALDAVPHYRQRTLCRVTQVQEARARADETIASARAHLVTSRRLAEDAHRTLAMRASREAANEALPGAAPARRDVVLNLHGGSDASKAVGDLRQRQLRSLSDAVDAQPRGRHERRDECGIDPRALE